MTIGLVAVAFVCVLFFGFAAILVAFVVWALLAIGGRTRRESRRPRPSLPRARAPASERRRTGAPK
jgi:hypothetical protein